ncbi:hypothetical protein FQN50_006699 [Emmonsiellopsis sp. PD_5]|nr:hypothetical protein FQN50_006699 [Emmonsiellopsis sp. PD_5]
MSFQFYQHAPVMTTSILPAELILHIGAHLSLHDLGIFIRTSKWHASLLTSLLYDRAFDFTDHRNKKTYYEAGQAKPAKPEADGETDSSTSLVAIPGTFSEKMWEAAEGWKSEFIVDYCMGNIDTAFIGFDSFVQLFPTIPEEEMSLLSVMVGVKNTHILQLLLARADVREKYLEREDSFEATPLGLAVSNGDITRVQMLLDAGANLFGSNGPNPAPILFYAAHQPSPEVVLKILHEVKAVGLDVSPVKTALNNKTPLHDVAEGGNVDFLKHFVAAGADIWARTGTGELPISMALRRGDLCRIMVDELLKLMLSQDPDGDWKNEILLTAASRGFLYDAVKQLVHKGADVFARDENGRTALELAYSAGNFQATSVNPWPGPRKEARHVAASILGADPYIWPPEHINRKLWQLAREGEVEESELALLNLLVRTGKSALEVGPDSGRHGHSALHYLCAIKRRPESLEPISKMVSLLLENGASISAQSNLGETPLFLAVKNNQTEIVQLLLQNASHKEIIHIAPTGDPSGLDPCGITPFLAAVSNGNLEVAKLLLEAGADAFARCQCFLNMSALHVAAASEHADEQLLRFLIDLGCPPSAVNGNGGTPLHMLVGRLFTPCIPGIKLLLDAGCPANVPDDRGETALFIALAQPRVFEEMMRLVGTDIVKHDDDGSGSLVCNIIKQVENQSMQVLFTARLLLEHGATLHHCDGCDKYRDALLN